MTYPPKKHTESDPAVMIGLMQHHAFAHLISCHNGLQEISALIRRARGALSQ